MKDTKLILKRAMKHGFDLSFIRNYNEKKIIQGLYDFLITNHYYCSLENGVVYVGIEIVEDVAEVSVENKTMKIKPLVEKGFFDVLITLFKYIKFVSSTEDEDSDDDGDISTETDDDSSEEMWL